MQVRISIMLPRAVRVWDKTSKQMLYPQSTEEHGLFLALDGSVVQFQKGKFVKLTDTCIPMYYTGLNDSRGTPMWEGDILEVGAPTEFGSAIKTHAIMRWDRGQAKWYAHLLSKPMNEEIQSDAGYSVSEPIVVGNVYQHPNLLKQYERLQTQSSDV